MKKSTLIVLAVIVLALVSAYVYLRSAHVRLADQYDRLLTEFAAAPPMCPSRPEQGSAAELYAQAFDQLPATAREFELWNAGQMKALGKQPAAEAPLYRLWNSFGQIFLAKPSTAEASPDVLACLGIEAPRAATDPVVRGIDVDTCRRIKLLEPSRRLANAATLRQNCASPYSPVNGWAKGGKPIYGFMTLGYANRLQAHLLELAGRQTEAAELRAQTVTMLLDLQRDAPLLEYVIASEYLRTTLLQIADTVPRLSPPASTQLRQQLDRVDAEWLAFYRITQAEGLWITPTLLLPGVDLERSVRNEIGTPIGSESLLLWFAAPAYLDLANDLTATTFEENLLASIEAHRKVNENFGDDFFLPLITSEISSVSYEAIWRVRHSKLRLLRLQLAGADTDRLLAELTDPVTGQLFRASERQFSSAATDAAFRKTVEEKYAKYLADELSRLTVERIR